MSLKCEPLLVACVWGASLHAGGVARGDQEARTANKPSDTICHDSQGGAYSPGAVIEVDGKMMECVVGPHWVPAGSAPADSTADVLDVGDTNIAARIEARALAALNEGR